eukprot:7376548-Prymnesium_polylepis.1
MRSLACDIPHWHELSIRTAGTSQWREWKGGSMKLESCAEACAIVYGLTAASAYVCEPCGRARKDDA